MIFIVELIAAAAVMGILSWLLLKSSPENIETREKLCRNRIAGIAFALPTALLCVPLAIPVTPGFLLLWLWPLAIVLPVLCFFHLDYYASRGWAFFLILFAYDTVHGVFENHTPAAPLITVIALLAGIAGIWVSAKPCTLRDIFRKAARSEKWKYTASAASALIAVTAFYTLIMTIYGVFAR